MKKVVYLNNYMLEDVIEARNNKNIFSQPANNKINAIRKSLEVNNVNVEVISSGLTNNETIKKYRMFKSNLDDKLTYSSIIDFPLLNTISSILSMFSIIEKINKENKIDNIIFYNYKPEVAWAAWLAKKILGIKITLEYEDGYSSVEGLSYLKKSLFKLTENIVSRSIDSAIIVTSKLQDKVKVKSVVVRGIIDEEFLHTCSKNKNLKEKITVMYSGGLDKERGIEVFLNSLEYIDEDIDVIISGKGSLENIVKENCDKRINFLGFVDYSVVKENLMNSHILVNCQLENHKFGLASFPSKIFEYMATGNKIISSKCSDVEEFSKNTFYFYDNDDPRGLAEAIKDAIIDIKRNNNTYNNKLFKLLQKNKYEEIGQSIIEVLGD